MRAQWGAIGAAVAMAASLTVTLGGGTAVGVGSGPSVTIDDPGAVQAGPVTLTGRVGAQAGGQTTVLYVVDATNSTAAPIGSDCSGNGVVGPGDDLNGDGSVGDILDCEIAGVSALNASLASTPGVHAGLVAFANQAATAVVDPAGEMFVPTGATAADGRPHVQVVAQSVTRGHIGLYTSVDLGDSGAGSAFNNAVQAALTTLEAAPPGQRWITFLSDGQAAIDDGLLAQLTASGIHLRSFAIGADATCAPSRSLYKMAVATGEQCVLAPVPAALAVQLSGSEPDTVNSLTVTIDGVSVAASIDAVGGWRAPFTLGAGSYTAAVRAVLASGVIATAERTFSVNGATLGPEPGTVRAGPGALKPTAVRLARPRPTREALPPRVSGRVGRVMSGFVADRALAGSTVRLQARRAAGAPWVTVDRSRARADGRFVLNWVPKARFHLLRVALVPPEGYAPGASAVPRPPISDCHVTNREPGWIITCRTTAKAGSTARLLMSDHVVDRSKVRRGTIRLHGEGKVIAHHIDLVTARDHHMTLNL